MPEIVAVLYFTAIVPTERKCRTYFFATCQTSRRDDLQAAKIKVKLRSSGTVRADNPQFGMAYFKCSAKFP